MVSRSSLRGNNICYCFLIIAAAKLFSDLLLSVGCARLVSMVNRGMPKSEIKNRKLDASSHFPEVNVIANINFLYFFKKYNHPYKDNNNYPNKNKKIKLYHINNSRHYR